jgi:hypothetical protein
MERVLHEGLAGFSKLPLVGFQGKVVGFPAGRYCPAFSNNSEKSIALTVPWLHLKYS